MIKINKIAIKIKENMATAKAQAKSLKSLLRIAPKKAKPSLIRKLKHLRRNIQFLKEQKKEVGKKEEKQ